MIPTYYVWLEHQGEVFLSVWQYELLEAIDEMDRITSEATKLLPIEGHSN
jgi:hypothetical protein